MSKKKSRQRAAYEKVRDMVLDKMSGDLHELLRKPMNSVTVSATVGDPWNRMVYVRGQQGEGVLLKVEPVNVTGVRDGLNTFGYTRAVDLLRESGHITAEEAELFAKELRENEAEALEKESIEKLKKLAASHGYTIRKA